MNYNNNIPVQMMDLNSSTSMVYNTANNLLAKSAENLMSRRYSVCANGANNQPYGYSAYNTTINYNQNLRPSPSRRFSISGNNTISKPKNTCNTNIINTLPKNIEYDSNLYHSSEINEEYDNMGFKTVHNIRDLGVSTKNGKVWVKPGMFFRSATLDHASEEEIKRLVEDININTIIDLRSEVEVKSAEEQGRAFVSFPATVASHLKKKDLVKKDLHIHHKDRAKVTNQVDHKTIMINFAGRRYRQHAVIYAAPFKVKKELVQMILSDKKPMAVTLVGRQVISPKGLIGLYKDFIDYCYCEIGEALKHLVDASNYPILVHCTQGKDRTGLVIALALYSLGVPEELIVADYAKSGPGLAPVKSLMVSEMARDGLDPSFSDAPALVLRQTFFYIKEQYGSVEKYLDRAKFTSIYRQALCKILSPSYQAF